VLPVQTVPVVLIALVPLDLSVPIAELLTIHALPTRALDQPPVETMVTELSLVPSQILAPIPTLARTVDLVTTMATEVTAVDALATLPDKTVNAMVSADSLMIPTFLRLNGQAMITVKKITQLDVWEVLSVFTNQVMLWEMVLVLLPSQKNQLISTFLMLISELMLPVLQPPGTSVPLTVSLSQVMMVLSGTWSTSPQDHHSLKKMLLGTATPLMSTLMPSTHSHKIILKKTVDPTSENTVTTLTPPLLYL